MDHHLANLLALAPLDRVEVNDRRASDGITIAAHANQSATLPFWYFQRALPDGMLELRSPGGYVDTVAPQALSDVIAGRPLAVRAMPQPVFLARLALAGKAPPPAPECFAPAQVLYAIKDRFNRADLMVWFDEPALNVTGRPWRAILPPDEAAALCAQARRSRMPVIGCDRGAPATAAAGCAQSERYHCAVVRTFMNAAVAGNAGADTALAQAALSPLSMAQLNRMAAPACTRGAGN